MKHPITPTEPRSIDEQNDVTDSLPTFVTRTTLRSILHANGVKNLLELEARSNASAGGDLVPSETLKTE